MKARTAIMIGFALLLAHPFALQAQIPGTLSYQGVLTDASGNIKPDGPYSFTFRLYDVSSGGTALWTETETNTVKDGLFSTTLGDQTAFPASLIFDQPYWLGIEVEGEELSPRITLNSSPYSLRAARADTALIVISPEEAPYGSVIKAHYLKVINQNGAAAYFVSEGGSSDALRVTNMGYSNAAQFDQGQSDNGNPAVLVKNFGAGEALYLETYEGTNNDPVIYATTSGGGYAGYFVGDVYTTGSYQPSDARFKKNISPINNALSTVQSLRGVKFEWDREKYPDNNFRSGNQYGLIAQEVEEILPELVRDDQDGYKAVDYQKVTAVLVEAIKEQQKEIEALKAAVAALQDQPDVALQE